ncbi:MAG: single stranded DNA-binding domain-containing protein, partial [Terriglobales bacterium]
MTGRRVRGLLISTVMALLPAWGALGISLPVLRTLGAVRDLTPTQAGLQYQVRVRGTVTYSDTDPTVMPRRDFYLQGTRDGLYVEGPAGTHFKSGDQVEVTGRSAPGDFAPVILATRVRILGHARFPAPAPTGGAALTSGAEDAQWVQLQGVVHHVAATGQRTELKLEAGNTPVHVFVAQPRAAFQQHFPALLGSRVSVTGVVKTLYNAQRQNLGFEIWVPSLAQFHVERAGPPEPFLLPRDDIGSLLRFDPRGVSR